MAIIELSVHKNYVSDWGVWEGIREIMQNAMDEHDKGNPISVEHDADQKHLVVGNAGSELTIRHLLIGFTTKAEDKKSRGEKGEGLDLGMLALVREGFEIEVRTPTETWVPYISKSEKWGGEEVLFIKTRKISNRRDGTYITIKNVTSDIWEKLKFRFLEFNKIDEKLVIRGSYYGDLLLGASYAGNIYVKGIYVQTDHELKYGYNLLNTSLDRDRRMVSSFDLQWATANILNSAVEKRPKLMAETVFNMLNNETKDVKGMGSSYGTSEKVRKIMANLMEAEHGEGVVPVSSIKESEEMESFGRKSAMTTNVLRDVVSPVLDTPAMVHQEVAKSTLETYSWGDLDENEQGILKEVASLINDALRTFKGNKSLCSSLSCHSLYGAEGSDVLDSVKISTFRDEHLFGLCNLKTGEIELSRGVLGNSFLTLRTLIHELSHRISGSGDTQRSHTCEVEEIWTAVTYVRNTFLN